MRRLAILLLEGFRDDKVVVRVDGTEVARRTAVTSSPLTGLAAELHLEVPDSARRLAVALPSRGIEARAPLPEGDPTMLVDLEEGALAVRPGTGREGGL